MLASSAITRIVMAAAAVVAFGGAGCRHASSFIWVDAVPKSMLAAETGSAISPGDTIGVRVLNQEASSIERVRVREDGKISMPLLNEVEVAGSEPSAVARRLEARLKAFITAPAVTVVIHERRALRVSVVGKIARPGLYDLDRGSGLLNALAASGGLTAFADEDALFVLRTGSGADGEQAPTRIRFRYRDLLAGKAPGVLFVLRAGDIVVVE